MTSKLVRSAPLGFSMPQAPSPTGAATAAILFGLLLASLQTTGCSQARAEPARGDRANHRAEALAARDDRLANTPAARRVPQACDGDLVEWHRAADITLCASPCSSDAMCAPGERCRVLRDGAGPADPPVFADDIRDEFLEAEALAADIAAHGPVYDDPPVCEGECPRDLTGEPIEPAPPLALCDPFAAELAAAFGAAQAE